MSIAEKLTTVAENVEKVYEAGINNGIEQGEQDGIRAMWEALQAGGTRTEYPRQLLNNMNFSKKTFKPIYDIRPKGADCYNWMSGTPKDTNLLLTEGRIVMKELEEEQGIVFDFSEVTNFDNAFRGGLFSELNVIDVSNEGLGNLAYTFYNGWKLEHEKIHRIERLICAEHVLYSQTFYGADKLYFIGFEGVIGNDIDLGSCPLIKDSITKLFNTLSATTEGKTVTLKKSAVNAAFGINVDDETTFPEGSEYYTLRHSKDNWTVNYI